MKTFFTLFVRIAHQLDVSWNEIRGEGAISIWKSLVKHTGLTALDMSWNSIGQHNGENPPPEDLATATSSNSDGKASPPKSPPKSSAGKRPGTVAPGSSRY